jgi:hypothetical protein
LSDFNRRVGLALRTDVHTDDVAFILEGALAKSLVVVVVVVESLAEQILQPMLVAIILRLLST